MILLFCFTVRTSLRAPYLKSARINILSQHLSPTLDSKIYFLLSPFDFDSQYYCTTTDSNFFFVSHFFHSILLRVCLQSIVCAFSRYKHLHSSIHALKTLFSDLELTTMSFTCLQNTPQIESVRTFSNILYLFSPRDRLQMRHFSILFREHFHKLTHVPVIYS